MAWDHDCAIIGGGPGGLVSALYLRRFRRSVVIVNAGKPRAAWIPRTHNLLGFPLGISGESLLKRLNRQVNCLGAERVRAQAVVRRAKRGAGFEIDCPGHGTLRARAVILATGVEDVQPDLHNLIALRKAGLLRYCAVCDAYDHRDRKLAVLARDAFGIRKALFLRHFARGVRIVVPEDLKVPPTLVALVKDAGAVLRHGALEAIERTPRGPHAVEICLSQGKPIECDAVYVELGCRVRDEAFRGMRCVRRTKEGFILATNEGRAGAPGLFAVGDCVNLLAQLSVAAGQAAVAATTIHNDLCDY